MSNRGGMSGHESPVNQTSVWLTPRHILQALGPFDLDPCACDPPRPWPTANEHLVAADNGLAHPWHGRVWLNPPYGAPAIIGPWMRRMAAHNKGTAIIFARTETALFHECVWEAASAVLFLKGRLHFHRPDGRQEGPAGAPSCLVAYGRQDALWLELCGLAGAFVSLR